MMSGNLMSVSSLNTKIGSLLEATFMQVMVEGEIASVTYHTSGHLYFSIKDDKSTLRCVMWRSNAARLKFRLAKGEHIVVEGSIGVYVPRGEYQLMATHVEPYGKGALAVAFEQLKAELEAKGYFDPAIKKPLPPFPRRIVLVTAAGGAALQDMLKVAHKRWPLTEITVVDVLVQGDAAAGEIARGIAYADGLGADIIVIGRGGGSTEDLWAFNEKEVAEAIHAARTPVVSAVGHEVDTLISDWVADLRAPTPSAAMEMILPDRDEWRQTLDEWIEQMSRQWEILLHRKQTQIDALYERFTHVSPMMRLVHLQKRFDEVADAMQRTIRYRLEQHEHALRPVHDQLVQAMAFVMQRKHADAQSLRERIALLDPAKRTKEGYAEIVRDGKRVALRDLAEGEVFELVDREIKMRVKGLEKVLLKQS
jgi:exodeoxyribonuclease VII large subunit